MKIWIVQLFALACSLSVIAQHSNGYVINGTIANLKSGTQIFLLQNKDTVSTTVALDNGKFIFRGKVEGGVNVYSIGLDTSLRQVPSKPFYLTNENIQVATWLEDWPRLNVGGSKFNDDLKSAQKEIKFLKANRSDTGTIFTPGEWSAFRKQYQHSLAAPLIIKELTGNLLVKPEDALEFFNSLSPAIKSSILGVETEKYVKIVIKWLVASEKVKEGQLLPDFNIITLDGKNISVLDLARQNKYTLIDFWASWCIPCRAEIPNIKDVYSKFSERGLGIVGISVDSKHEEWKKAVQEDKTSWTHGIDTANNALELLTISSVPSFILLNNDGKMVSFTGGGFVRAFGPPIRGKDLTLTLESLFSK